MSLFFHVRAEGLISTPGVALSHLPYPRTRRSHILYLHVKWLHLTYVSALRVHLPPHPRKSPVPYLRVVSSPYLNVRSLYLLPLNTTVSSKLYVCEVLPS